MPPPPATTAHGASASAEWAAGLAHTAGAKQEQVIAKQPFAQAAEEAEDATVSA